jgi:hypothetical protein
MTIEDDFETVMGMLNGSGRFETARLALYRIRAAMTDKPSGKRPRPFGPLVEGDPEIGKPCPACGKPFEIGQHTTLVALGPSDDPEQQELARAGRTYDAVAIQAHYPCVTGIVIEG